MFLNKRARSENLILTKITKMVNEVRIDLRPILQVALPDDDPLDNEEFPPKENVGSIKCAETSKSIPLINDNRVSKLGLSLKGNLLPECDKFLIMEKEINKFTEAWEVSRVWQRKIKITKFYKNPANIYLRKLYEVLDKYTYLAYKVVSEKKQLYRDKYDNLVLKALRYSRALRFVRLHKMSSRWYKSTSYKKIIGTLKKLTRLCLRTEI